MTAAPSSVPQAPNSVPPRVQIERSLEHLLQSLLELGICASDVQESALESSPDGVAAGSPGGLIGRKTTQTIESFARLYSQKDLVGDVMIPLEVISAVDQGRNPHQFTKDFIERLSGENMYTNGILSAVTDYRDLLTSQIGDAFPDLVPTLNQLSPSLATQRPSNPPQPTGPTDSSTLAPDAVSSSSIVTNSNGIDSMQSHNDTIGLNGNGFQSGGQGSVMNAGAGGEDVKMEE